MKKKLVLGVLAVLITMTLTLSYTKQEKTVPEHKNTLRLYLQAEPFSLDPRVGGERRSQMLLRELFEGLYRVDESGDPVPALAKHTIMSPDQTKYTFVLHETKWSNGDPVTAYDFEYAWKSNVTPSFVSHYPYAFFIIKNGRKAKLGEVPLDAVGIKAVNATTLEVELEHPAPYFFDLLANPLYSPVHKTIATKNHDWHTKSGPLYVCNGPFALDTWAHKSEIVLKKNHLYADAAHVPLAKISFVIIENPQTALHMYERNDIDWVGEPFGNLTLESIPTFAKQGRLQTYQLGGMSWFLFNTTQPLLSSAKIRRALSYAINRNEITRHLLQGGEIPAFSILPKQYTLLDQPLFQDHDVAQAKYLFEQGLQELNMTKDTPLVITHWNDPKEKVIAEAVQEQWQKTFGIKIQLHSCDWSLYMQKIRTAEFHTLLANWWSWYRDPIYNLEFIKYRDSGFNGTRWENKKYIALLDKSDLERNLEKRKELLKQAEMLVIEEMPLAPLYCQTYKFVKQPYVKGVYLSPLGQLELKHASVNK